MGFPDVDCPENLARLQLWSSLQILPCPIQASVPVLTCILQTGSSLLPPFCITLVISSTYARDWRPLRAQCKWGHWRLTHQTKNVNFCLFCPWIAPSLPPMPSSHPPLQQRPLLPLLTLPISPSHPLPFEKAETMEGRGSIIHIQQMVPCPQNIF